MIASQDPATYAENVSGIPAEVIAGVKYKSAMQAVMILVEELATKSHGAETRFVRSVRGELEEVEKIRRESGEKEGEWLQIWGEGRDGSGEGRREAEKAFAGLRELAEYAWVFLEPTSSLI